MLKYAIIGHGGLGKTHFRAYNDIKNVMGDEIKLVALCDIRKEAFTTSVATNLGDDTAWHEAEEDMLLVVRDPWSETANKKDYYNRIEKFKQEINK